MSAMRRRPPFALVLIALLAVAGGAIALLNGGGSSNSTSIPSTPNQGAASVCVTARARTEATVTQTLRAPVTVAAPLSVTEPATAGRSTVFAAPAENVLESAT